MSEEQYEELLEALAIIVGLLDVYKGNVYDGKETIEEIKKKYNL